MRNKKLSFMLSTATENELALLKIASQNSAKDESLGKELIAK